MNRQTLSRLIAAAIMVVIVASGINIDRVTRGRLGRDAFLQHQGDRYDRYFADPNLDESLLESLLVCAAFIAIYELIAFNTFKVLTFINEAKPKTDGAS